MAPDQRHRRSTSVTIVFGLPKDVVEKVPKVKIVRIVRPITIMEGEAETTTTTVTTTTTATTTETAVEVKKPKEIEKMIEERKKELSEKISKLIELNKEIYNDYKIANARDLIPKLEELSKKLEEADTEEELSDIENSLKKCIAEMKWFLRSFIENEVARAKTLRSSEIERIASTISDLIGDLLAALEEMDIERAIGFYYRIKNLLKEIKSIAHRAYREAVTGRPVTVEAKRISKALQAIKAALSFVRELRRQYDVPSLSTSERLLEFTIKRAEEDPTTVLSSLNDALVKVASAIYQVLLRKIGYPEAHRVFEELRALAWRANPDNAMQILSEMKSVLNRYLAKVSS